ncbi:MAG: hypothetical protein E7D27_03235 [Clostridium celatum]|nr:hypothetical protein [Clostridium celatum]
MYARINDSRVNDNSMREVFTYAREEKETNLVFDYQEKVWRVWTSVPEHITKLLKLKNHNLEVDSVTETGTITSIKGTISSKQVSFRNIIELTEERKAKLKNRGKELSMR